MKLLNTKATKEKYAKRELSAANYIPYSCHWNRRTILSKSNELIQVVKISGFPFETADDDDLDIRKNMRNLLFKNLASGNITLYFHTIRKKKPLAFTDSDYSFDPTVQIPNDFVTYLSNEWKKKYRGALTRIFMIKIVSTAIVSACTLISVVWFIASPEVRQTPSTARTLFLIIHLILLAATGIAGHIGGKLVFKD